MKEFYENPLNTRYASDEMKRVFSPDTKFKTWRKLWIALAKAEKKLGINITDEQIRELESYSNDINYEDAIKREKETRHDVMSHVYAYSLQCPTAKPIIHLGATSCFVGDNTDIIVMKQAVEIIKKKLVNTIKKLSDFSIEFKDMPTLGFTHYQPAQLTTVSKRASLWLYDFILDLEQLENLIDDFKLRGVKGTTGTQASFLELFDGDNEKVYKLNELVCESLGFEKYFLVSGQTYTRKFDTIVLNILALIAQSAYKFSNDIRLLQNLKEIEEPFEKSQIGSSAMAYKRNPMRSERISSLARYVINLPQTSAVTASTQWFERTLDDSAIRRINIPEAFLAVDAILEIMINVTDGLVVYPKVIEKRILSELPFMATENILMDAVKKGGDRQELHEKIREHSMEAAKKVKMEGLDNDLIDRILSDDDFDLNSEEVKKILLPEKFIGRASLQVMELYENATRPILEKYKDLIGIEIDLKV